RHASLTVIASSSRNSRIRVSSGRSPFSTLPPGNSQRPAIDLPCGLCAINTRPSVSTSAQAAMRTILRAKAPAPGLRAIVAVDGDVFFGEIAGENAIAAFAQPECNFQADFGFLHCLAHGRFIIAWIACALMRDADAAKTDRYLVPVRRLTRFTDGHHDTAPVCVFAGDRGLDQRG